MIRRFRSVKAAPTPKDHVGEALRTAFTVEDHDGPEVKRMEDLIEKLKGFEAPEPALKVRGDNDEDQAG